MCVTNTTHRRAPAISLNQSQILNAGVLSQRLLGGYLPTAAPKPQEPVVSAAPAYLPPQEKTRPKRRRKPQKPGKTAKMNDRHFVVHNYHDHADDAEVVEDERRRGGVAVAFPVKLHAVLDQVQADGLAHVISWQPHGRCFVIHRPKEFVDYVMPRYFRQSKLTSFQRQLNLYGFSRLTRGADAGGYYHELFLRGKVSLCKRMQRTKVKGTKFKAASSPDQEPDFYAMKPVTVTPVHSDEEQSYTEPASMYQAPQPQQLQFPVVQPTSYLDPLEAFQQQPEAALTDQVFDEAVNELFMEDIADPALSDFVHDWDPTQAVEPDIQDDTQLGFLLEKLLD